MCSAFVVALVRRMLESNRLYICQVCNLKKKLELSSFDFKGHVNISGK